MARSVNVAMTRLASVAHCVFCSRSTGRLTLTVAWKCRMFIFLFFSNFVLLENCSEYCTREMSR